MNNGAKKDNKLLRLFTTIIKRLKNAAAYFKDFIIYGAIIALLIYIALQYFNKPSINAELMERITQYVGTVVTILLGVIGIIEFAFDNGLSFLVPTSFEKHKERKLNEQTKHYLNEFFHREAEYFSQHSNSRITYLLNQLGLNRNQFDRLKMSILTIKLMPLHSRSDAVKKIREIVKSANIILHQDGLASDELVYKQVSYYVNFADVMFIDDYRAQITDCLAYLIREETEAEKITYNRIAIAHKGNFLLGISISEKLNTALIRVTREPLILRSKSWIGNFEENTQNETIFIHDVLVSGEQIKESINKISSQTKISAIFCLINRLDFDGKKKLEDEFDIPIYSLWDLSDDDIEDLLNEDL